MGAFRILLADDHPLFCLGGMTLRTAETHRSNIMLKLKLHCTVELVLYALRNEIAHVQLPSFVERDPQNGNGRVLVALQELS